MPTLSHPRGGRGRPLTVGVDVGTTAVKALAVGAGGQVEARVRIPHRPMVPAPGRLEHDAVAAWVEGPRRALADLGVEPAAVAVSALAPSLAPVDAAGRPCGPGILYDDERGRPAGPYTGADPAASPETVELLRWTASAGPAAGYWPAQAVATRAVGGPGVVDYATAVATGPLFDGAGWDPAVCRGCGVEPDQLPAVRMFGEAVGAAGGTVIGAGSVDAFCEQLVAGPLADGDALVVLGSTLVAWVSVPDADDRAGLWRVPQLEGGRWLVGGASNAGGLWLGWVDRVIAPGDPSTAVAGGVPVWAPYPRGERVPLHDPSRRAELAGADLTQGPAALRRAALEASGFAVRRILERTGRPVRRIVATGGGSAHRPWLQAIADATGAIVDAVAVPEGAALGAAWLARMAAGLEAGTAGAAGWAATGCSVEPDPAWAQAMEERYHQFAETAGRGGGTGRRAPGPA